MDEYISYAPLTDEDFPKIGPIESPPLPAQFSGGLDVEFAEADRIYEAIRKRHGMLAMYGSSITFTKDGPIAHLGNKQVWPEEGEDG